MNEFHCENFLAPIDPNAAGYLQSYNFLRQWTLHGPVPMSTATRRAAETGQWTEVIHTEALPNEAHLQPKVQPVEDPREMVAEGAWMRWETHFLATHRRYPEKIVPAALLYDWYLPRHRDYPQADLPPGYVHLSIDAYSEEDELMPCWEMQGDIRLPLCPRCNRQVEMLTPECPGCQQRLGGYAGYSAPQWPRKYEWRPELPDDYSFYYIAAHIKAPAQMRRMTLLTGSESPYKIFLNAQEIGCYDRGHRFCQWDSDIFEDIELNTGWNLLLVKVAHDTIKDTQRSFFSRKEDRTAFFARLAMPDRSPIVVHDFATDRFAPECQLRITVSDPIPIGVGTTARLQRFHDGALVCSEFRSSDGGNTWAPCRPLLQSTQDNAQPVNPATWSKEQDPATLVLDMKCQKSGPGVYQARLCRSLDGWLTREVVDVSIFLADGADLVDEGNIETGPGNIRGNNIVALPDGTLLVPMYGSLQQDVVWFDLRMFGGYLKYPQSWPRQFKYRSWVLRSEDGGLTWHYHGTIAALPELGDEGFGEPNIAVLQDGSIIAILRNGGGDEGPLWTCRSWDGGQTWSYPVVTNTPTGNAPQIAELPNGVLACSYGRPGNRVSFDLTGSGLAWSHTVQVSNCYGNDHIEIAVTGPDSLFCAYADDEFDVAGNPMPNKVRQKYGRHIKVERL